jgi:O-methyltransferase involved in polyketide biosynthesis
LKARLANASRKHAPDHPVVVELRRDYLAEVLAEHVSHVVAAAPPFTDDQIDRIVGVLQGAAL